MSKLVVVILVVTMLCSACVTGSDSSRRSEIRRMEFTVVEVRTVFPYEVKYQFEGNQFQYLSNHCRAVYNIQVGATYASEYIVSIDKNGNESIEQLPDICSIAKVGPDPIRYPEVRQLYG